MKRKLMKVGDSSALISLPYKWVQENNLKKGDELDVTEKGNTLVIGAETTKSREGSFDFSSYPLFLIQKMIARIYEMGYDKVTIKYSTLEQVKTIEGRLPELMGFELIDLGQSSVVVQDISTANTLDFDNLMRKAFMVTKNMFNTIIDDMKNNDLSRLDTIKELDLKLNKFTYFCLRQINKNIVASEEAYVLFYLAKSLEDLGDIIKRFIDELKEYNKVDKLVLDTLIQIDELFNTAYDFFYKPQMHLAVDSLKLNDQILETIKESSKKTNNQVPLLMHLSQMARKIYHFPTLRLHTLVE